MLKDGDGLLEITCDKCGQTQAEPTPRDEASRRLYESGWTMNRDARKYVHLCRPCAARRPMSAKAEGRIEAFIERLNEIQGELYRYAYERDERGERYPAWSELAAAYYAVDRAIDELRARNSADSVKP